MNKSEAYGILAGQLVEFFDFEELAQRLPDRPTEEFTILAESGVSYHVKIDLAWDEKFKDKVRMTGSVIPVDEADAEMLTQVLLVPPPPPPRQPSPRLRA